jgi:hypothetical protein
MATVGGKREEEGKNRYTLPPQHTTKITVHTLVSSKKCQNNAHARIIIYTWNVVISILAGPEFGRLGRPIRFFGWVAIIDGQIVIIVLVVIVFFLEYNISSPNGWMTG